MIGQAISGSVQKGTAIQYPAWRNDDTVPQAVTLADGRLLRYRHGARRISLLDGTALMTKAPTALPAPPDDAPVLPHDSTLRTFSLIANRASDLLRGMYGERYGISVIGWRVLAILGAQAPLAGKQIAELIGVDQVAVSRAIDHLSSLHMIERKTDAKDRRKQMINLSKRGQAAFDDIVPLFSAIEAAILSPLSKREQDQFRDMMHTLREHVISTFGEDVKWTDLIDG